MTLRGLDSQLAAKLREVAQQEGKSVNQTVLDALHKQFGLRTNPVGSPKSIETWITCSVAGTKMSSLGSSERSIPSVASIGNCGRE